MSKFWADYDVHAFVAFKPKHWFEIHIRRTGWTEYELSTQENWSSIHKNDEIVDYMDKVGFVVKFIHAGITLI